MSEKHLTYSASYIILERDGKVLLLRRANTGWQDGMYGLPSGHVEKGESPRQAAIREAQEEVGVTINLKDLYPVHVMHRKPKDENDREYYDFFFLVTNWQGEPENMEPGKCDQIEWFDLEKLPENILSYIRFVFDAMHRKDFYSER